MLKERERERVNLSPTRSASEGWLRPDSCDLGLNEPPTRYTFVPAATTA
jgi:hypothetical protein